MHITRSPGKGPGPAPRASLFRAGIGPRLAFAAALSALVWLMIAWAMAA